MDVLYVDDETGWTKDFGRVCESLFVAGFNLWKEEWSLWAYDNYRIAMRELLTLAEADVMIWDFVAPEPEGFLRRKRRSLFLDKYQTPAVNLSRQQRRSLFMKEHRVFGTVVEKSVVRQRCSGLMIRSVVYQRVVPLSSPPAIV
jgi:hypothetical protein